MRFYAGVPESQPRSESVGLRCNHRYVGQLDLPTGLGRLVRHERKDARED
jgi:hypothetical protein